MLGPLAAAPGTVLGALAEGAIATAPASSPPAGFATANDVFLLYPKYGSYQTAGGTNPVTANDQSIGRLTDHVGSHHFEGSGSTRPLRKTVSGIIVAQTDGSSLLTDIGTLFDQPDTGNVTVYAVMNHTLGKRCFVLGTDQGSGKSACFLYSDDKAYGATDIGDHSEVSGILASGLVACRWRKFSGSTGEADAYKWKFAASGAGGSEIYLAGGGIAGDVILNRLFSRTGFGGGPTGSCEAGEGIAYVHVFSADTYGSVGTDDATECAYIASEFGLTIPAAVAAV